ncbi:hypothetical protein NUU61_007687 [Penicillium alfredii]|uniref:Uncharacterized protein n=1 Tax=Penicillium alfredii TaxID=1506179 RepID=A0A9W9ER63_9EURO|nr:uncharacterized protein NUU61_007687 [Penicillium alfredii]KAJ5086380.1 hypothetical protein NUU61_007687 [Penicillium alfredii]
MKRREEKAYLGPDVSPSLLSSLTNNINSTGSLLSCPDHSCPLMESAHAISLDKFNESDKLGDVARYLAADHTRKLLVLGFRGSRALITYIADFEWLLTDSSFCKECKVQSGFWLSWKAIAKGLEGKIDAAQKKYPAIDSW